MADRNVFASADALAADFVHRTREASDAAIAARGRFTVALTGGSAATSLYPVLAQAPLDWSRVHVFFGDERCVPPDHKDSNYKLAHDSFLSRVAIPAANVHRMEGERDPAAAAADYEAVLFREARGVLDVVHVGMGPDGHICSLFPGHPLLAEESRAVTFLTDSPKPPPSRITLTLGALKDARALWFLVLGGSKDQAAHDALLDAKSNLPAAIASRTARSALWFMDHDAARLLK